MSKSEHSRWKKGKHKHKTTKNALLKNNQKQCHWHWTFGVIVNRIMNVHDTETEQKKTLKKRRNKIKRLHRREKRDIAHVTIYKQWFNVFRKNLCRNASKMLIRNVKLKWKKKQTNKTDEKDKVW